MPFVIAMKQNRIMKGYLVMSNRKFVESKTADKNTLQTQYKFGNSVYFFNSHFVGKDNLYDLIFNILLKKSNRE